MKINLIVIGQLKNGPEHDLIQKYQKRLHWKLNIKQLASKKNVKGTELKAVEAELIRAHLVLGAPLITLDERGQNLTSSQFAQGLQKFQVKGISELNICIGGAEGLDSRLRDQADCINLATYVGTCYGAGTALQSPANSCRASVS
jgi:23S rRNA (pseudouridine1915-N3)-methyltransferase